MAEAFTIMQIGNPDLDEVYRHAIIPAVKAFDLDPKRVDKHNEGRLLKSEIVRFIEVAEIIVADLTNERPNCYLEVGYAMGQGKFRNLILTAREDHHHDSPNYKKGGPKIHFDLSGYDILFWHRDKLDQFKDDLVKRIRHRRESAQPTSDLNISTSDLEPFANKQTTTSGAMLYYYSQEHRDRVLGLFPPEADLADMPEATASSSWRTRKPQNIFKGKRLGVEWSLAEESGWFQAAWPRPIEGRYVVLINRKSGAGKDPWGPARVYLNEDRIADLEYEFSGLMILVIDLVRRIRIEKMRFEIEGLTYPGLSEFEIY